MDVYSTLSETLRLCIERRCQQYGSAIFIALAIGCVELYLFHKLKQECRRDNKKNSEKKKKKMHRTMRIVIGAGAVCIMLFVIGLLEILPAVRDLSEQRFVQITTTYHHNNHSVGTIAYLRDGFVTIKDGTCHLDLPPNWSEETFPYGYHYGEVWYSENSKFILSFTNLEEGES